jgi:hypothetical protein
VVLLTDGNHKGELSYHDLFPLPVIFFRRTDALCGRKTRLSWLHEQLIDVTPGPILTGLEGLNERVVSGVEMLGGVLIFRIITATDVPTGETEAQVDPGIARFQAILASIGAWGDFTYLVKMTTVFCHSSLFPFKHFYSCLRFRQEFANTGDHLGAV